MINFEYYPDEIATTLYNLSCDMDKNDYNETKQDTINQLTDCLYQLMAICENSYNKDYFRTMYKCLETITSIYE